MLVLLLQKIGKAKFDLFIRQKRMILKNNGHSLKLDFSPIVT